MLDKFVANLLTSYLGRYIANLDKQHVKVSVWNGHVVLHDLVMKPNALRLFDLPVSVKEGRIGELSVVIPWTRLQSESIRVEIKDVVLIVHPKKAAAYDSQQEAQDQWERKEEDLAIFETLRRAGTTDDAGNQGADSSTSPMSDAAFLAAEEAKDNTFAARLKASMLNNLHINISNVLLQYEDRVTHPHAPIALTARIGKLTVLTADADYKPAFASPKAKLLFKVGKIEELSLTIETFTSDFGGHTCKQLAEVYAALGKTAGGAAAPFEKQSFVMEPVHITLRLQHQPVPYMPDVPRWLVSAELAETVVHLNRSQWDAVWQSVKYVQRFEQYEAFLQYRPPHGVLQSPRQWWKFAFHSVCHVLRQQRNHKRFDWQKYVELKRLEREYLELHKRSQPNCPWLPPLSTAEVERHHELEVRLPIDNIKVARSLAYARVALEAQQHAARQEYLSKKQVVQKAPAAAGSKKGGGWWAWWTGATATSASMEEPVAETEEEQREIDKLWGLIDADRWSDEQRRVLARELGMPDESASPLLPKDDTSSPQLGPSESPLPSGSPTGAATSTRNTSKATCAFLRVSALYVALLDYDNKPFAAMSLESLCAAYRTCGGADYELHGNIAEFSLNDLVAGSCAGESKSGEKPSSTASRGTTTPDAIVRVARERLPPSRRGAAASFSPFTSPSFSTGRSLRSHEDWIPAAFSQASRSSALSVVYAKVTGGSPASSGTAAPAGTLLPDSVLTVDVQPMDIRTSVPWMQRIVSFWGVDTNLVSAPPPRTSSSAAALHCAIKSPADIVAEQVAALASHVERTQVTSIRITASDMCLVIPEDDIEQETRFHFERIEYQNGASKSLERRQRLSHVYGAESIASWRKRQRSKRRKEMLQTGLPFDASVSCEDGEDSTVPLAQAIDESDWVDEATVSLVNMSIFTSWAGSYDAPLIQKTSALIRTRRLLVASRIDTAMVAVECLFKKSLVFESPMEGYAVFFSALTAVTDFLSNASGRGTLTSTPGSASSGLSLKEEFVCRVEGPSTKYAVADENTLTPQQKFFTDGVVYARRVVEVSRGCLAVFHEKRPSMPYAKFELKPNAFHVARKNNAVTFFLTRGGKHHLQREHLFDARSILVSRLTLGSVSTLTALPLAQLWVLVSDWLLQNPQSTEDEKDEVLGSYAIIEECLQTVPCQTVVFIMDSVKDAERLEKTIARSVAVEGIVNPTPTPEEAFAKMQHALFLATGRRVVAPDNALEVMPQKMFDILLICEESLVMRVRPKTEGDSSLASAMSGTTPWHIREAHMQAGGTGAPLTSDELPAPSMFADWHASDAATTLGHLELAMEGGALLQFYLTMFTRDIHFSTQSLTMRARDQERLRSEDIDQLPHASSSGTALPRKSSTCGRDDQTLSVVFQLTQASSDLSGNTGAYELPQSPLRSPGIDRGPTRVEGGTTRGQLPGDQGTAEEAFSRAWGSRFVSAESHPVFLTFNSSWLQHTTPHLTLHCSGSTHLTLDDNFCAGAEILWDLLGVLMTKTFGCTVWRGIAWEEPIHKIRIAEDGIVERMVIDLHCQGPVTLLMKYETGGIQVNGNTLPMFPRGEQALLRGKHLQLRWRANDLLNETQLTLEEPHLETFFTSDSKQQQRSYNVFVTPRSRSGCGVSSDDSPFSDVTSPHDNDGNHNTVVAMLSFDYRVLYPPTGISEHAWKTSTGAHSGYHFTHYLTLEAQSLLCRYSQQDLWSLIEYTTNGLVQRLGFISWRKPFCVDRPQNLWPPPAAAPLPTFSTALIHKHVELRECDMCLPHDPHAAPQLWASVRRMTMFDRISVDRESGELSPLLLSPAPPALYPPYDARARCEVRTGFLMSFDGMKVWAAKPLPGQHAVRTAEDFNEKDVLFRDPSHTDLIVDELTMEYWMWFEAACLRRMHSQKTLGFHLHELHFHGSSEQLALVLDWICGVFLKNPWVPRYPPRYYPPTPYASIASKCTSSAAAPNQTPWIAYDYDITADRLLLHLRDPSITYAATPMGLDGPAMDRHPINVVADLRGVIIALQWLSDQSFSSRYAAKTFEAWDMLRVNWKLPHDMFVRSPREVVSASQLFLKLYASSESPSAFGLDVTYGWKQEADAPVDDSKIVFSCTTIGTLEVDVMPKFLFDIKDSLLSLRVRNAFAPLCKWPHVAAFQPAGPKWDPKTQEWRTKHEVLLASLTLMLFDASQKKPQPSFVITLQDISYAASSSKYHRDSNFRLVVGAIAQNGVCDERFSSRPIIVPQNVGSNNSAGGGAASTDPIFLLSHSSASGYKGHFGCVWIFSPLKEQLRRLRATLLDESLKDLQWIAYYAEERYARREGLFDPQLTALGSEQRHSGAGEEEDVDDNASNDVAFTIFHPCVVVVEHESVVSDTAKQRGIVINFGLMELHSSFVQTAAQKPSTVEACESVSVLDSPRRGHGSPMTATSGSGDNREHRTTRIYGFQLTGGNMKSLHRSSQQLIQPMNMLVEGARHANGTVELRVLMDGLTMIIPQEYYESVLRSIVRHWLVDEEEMVEQRAAQLNGDSASVRSGRSSATGFTTVTAAAQSRLRRQSIATSFSNDPSLAEATSTVSAAAKTTERTNRRVSVALDWKHVRLSVFSESVGVTFAIGRMTMKYVSEEAPRSLAAAGDVGVSISSRAEHAFAAGTSSHRRARDDSDENNMQRLHSSLTYSSRPECGEDEGSSPALEAQEPPSECDIDGLRAEDASDPDSSSALQSAQSVGNRDQQPSALQELASLRKRARRTNGRGGLLDSPRGGKKHYRVVPPSAIVKSLLINSTIEYLRLGVDGRQPIVSLSCRDLHDETPVGRPDATPDEDAPARAVVPMSLEYSLVDKTMKLKANLGVARALVEHDSVVQAISFLYEPYRRIVLPRYTVFEIKEVCDDFTLTQRLLLSSRTTLRVSSSERNHVTLNGNGHSIHCLESGGKALIVLEPGVTLRIINATVYLYGKPLEHYVTAGNGSYVVLDELLTSVIAGTVQTDADDGDEEVVEPADAAALLTAVRSFSAEEDVSSVTWVPRDSTESVTILAAFQLLIPEHSSKLTSDAPPSSSAVGVTTAAAQRSAAALHRALMLSAAATFAWTKTVERGVLIEAGAFDITELEAECQYIGRNQQKVDYSSLISPWGLNVHISGTKRLTDPHERTVTIKASSGVDFRFRYGDLELSLSAVRNARAALGHIESNVLATAAAANRREIETHEFAMLEEHEDGTHSATNSGRGSKKRRGKDIKKRRKGSNVNDDSHLIALAEEEAETFFSGASSGLTTRIVTDIPRVGVYLVDDSTSMDFPLFYASWSHITTPTFELCGPTTKLYLKLSMQVEYYNFYSSMWSRFLEPITFEVVLRDVVNLSLQDVQARKGIRKAGVRLSSVRLHISPMAADALSRTLKLVQRLGSMSSGTSTSSAAAAATGSSQEFFAYEVTQQLGPDISIGFAEDDKGRFPKPRVLKMMDVYPFNFPRIEGRELPTSQHYITVATSENAELLRVSKVGLQIITLTFGGIRQDVVSDIQVVGGKKRVTLRTNICFENLLPFPIVLAGVGSVFVKSSHTVCTEAMRKRCVFVPQLPHRCHPVSMGVTYDALPNHYSQTFLCTSVIDDAKSAQQAVYFTLRFAPKLKISDESHLYDCRACFEAPFSIVNNTGLAVTCGLHYKQFHMKARSGILDFTDKYYFVHVDSIHIPTETAFPITQVDPLKDVYLDITFLQSGGCNVPIGRTGAKKQCLPALIRSDKKAARDTMLTLHDPNGESINVRIDYADRQVILWVPFWIVNQTPHQLQIMDSNPRRRGYGLAGIAPDRGISPCTSPFIVGSEKMERLKEKAHIYIRVGRKVIHSKDPGALMWSQWSDGILIHPIGEWSVVNCGDTEAVSLSYSIHFVGGPMKETRVICFTPRWIVINRTPFALNLKQRGVRTSDAEEAEALAAGQNRMLDVADPKSGANSVQLRLASVPGDIDRCQWSQPISIEVFGDQNLNIRYEQVLRGKDGAPVSLRRESHVFHVSAYRRGSILYLAVERATVPPYVIENRTKYLIHAKQRDAQGKLVVYPHLSKGFVWDDSSQAPVLTMWASEGQAAASRAITLNLEASLLINKRTRYQLQQELQLPGGSILFVRVRAMAGSFAISICEDNMIDKMRTLPFFQFSYQLCIESLFTRVSTTDTDVILFTVKPLNALISQLCPPGGDNDEQVIDISVGVVQVDDERVNVQKKEQVVIQLLGGMEDRLSRVKLQRRMQRLTPILHVTALEVNLQPVEVHLEDSFLFEVLKLVESLRDTLAGSAGSSSTAPQQLTSPASSSEAAASTPTGGGVFGTFTATPWLTEVSSAQATSAQNDDSLSNKVAFIEKLTIEHFFVSVSLYRDHDALTDPIRDKLGFLSVLIRSVQDAHIDWRRVEQTNVYDRIWLLATLYSNFYMHTLQQQVLNVLHVAGLDVMRGFVTDLLSQYFSSTVTTQIDRTKPRVPRRSEAHFLEDIDRETADASPRSKGALGSPRSALGNADGSGAWDTMEDAQQITAGSRWLKFGGSAKALVGMETLAYQVSWNEFMEQATNADIRLYGHHALCHAIRSRSFSSPAPPSLCRRCLEIDQLRQERIESGSMSVLPHPDTQALTWPEFTHHVSWEEFISICTPAEIRRYAHLVRDAILEKPHNVIRVDGGLMWCLKEQ